MRNEEFLSIDGIIYPGLGRRFVAALIDGALFMAIGFVALKIGNLGRLIFIYALITNALLYFLYNVYLLSQHGATIGKMALGIKVVKINGQKVGIISASLRYIIVVILQLFRIAIPAVALLKMTDQQFHSMGLLDRAGWMAENAPDWGTLVITIRCAWWLCDILFLFCNKRKRALHDYIAGTVVVDKQCTNS